MLAHEIPVQATCRYYTCKALDDASLQKIRKVVYVLHGYGQLAQFFLKKFEGLFSEEVLFVAPEGPNLFYQNGFSGRVAATWMTKENRTAAISTYVSFLDSIADKMQKAFPQAEHKGLGFSQGATTAARWQALGSNKVDSLVLWAGAPPHDIDWKQASAIFASQNLKYVCGKQDQFFDEHKRLAIREHFKNSEIPCKWLAYDGDHDIEIATAKLALDL